MINKKNLLMLSILFAAVAGMSISSVMADNLGATTYKTEKLYFTKSGAMYDEDLSFYKKLATIPTPYGPISDGIFGGYRNKPNNGMIILAYAGCDSPSTFKVTKADVTFKKTVNGKTQYSTKTLYSAWDAELKNYAIEYYPKNDYKPYYAYVYYQKK